MSILLAGLNFFQGSTAGQTFKPIIEQTAQLVVLAVSILEVHRFLSRSATATARDSTIGVMCRSPVIELTTSRAIAASEIAQKHSLTMADAVMCSNACEFNAMFWTQDIDYKDLPSVNYHARP